MTSWAIVAIPEDGESVWQISSEKIPHMTLLFLGEQDDPHKALHITEYLQHAVNTSMFKFGATVRHRGILGDESADVLFFENNERISEVRDFRSYLLTDTVINDAYHSTEQFEGWTPHLTLGYPSRPARKAEGVHSLPLYAVYFDRIALWVDDFDGPTFNLEYRDNYAMAMDSLAHRNSERAAAHKTPETPRDVVMRNVLARNQLREPSNLKHHGIGARVVSYKNPIEDAVRKTLGPAGVSARELNNEGRFFKHAISGALQHGSSADPKKVYVRENQLAFLRHLEHSVGGRPSERADREFDLATRPDGDWVLSSIDRVAHTGTVESHIHPILDEYGRIQNYELVHDQLTQDDMRCALMHFGVKGMKWGVRRKSPSEGSGSGSGGTKEAISKARESRAEKREAAATAKAVRKDAQNEAGETGLKSRIKKPNSSEEAATTAETRSRTKKHGTDVLSNKELQDMVTRMNLEQQYQNLMDAQKAQKARSSGREYISDILKQAGAELANEAIKYAATEAAKSAFTQATDSNSRTRTWVRNEANNSTSLSPQMRQLLTGQRQRQLT